MELVFDDLYNIPYTTWPEENITPTCFSVTQ